MGSLFTKIFLSFWLAALLLVLVFTAIQGIYGGDVVHEAEERLREKADTVATLWDEDRHMLLRRWLRQQPQELRPFLVDDDGDTIFRQPLPPHLRDWMPHELEAGRYRIAPGHIVIVTPVRIYGEDDDELFLLSEIPVGQFQALPVWSRIAIAGLIIGLVSLGLSALLTRRLRQLREAAQALAAGNLDVRVHAKGSDEVAALGQDFDLMADRLNDMLEAQRRLLSDVSHELRSPLARMRVALEIADQNQDREKALARISKEADELEQLITHVLSLARLESGNAQINRKPVQLDELVKQIARDADFEAQARQRQVHLSVDGEKFDIQADPVLLRSAIENVVRNALHHTPENSSVDIELQEETSGFLISVRDHGTGIAEDKLQEIFKPFMRASEARDRDSGGYGLGLAITAGSIRVHDGSCRADNHPDGGLEITLHIPIDKSQ
jgi:two-component system sensor histidine kinase CpxA